MKTGIYTIENTVNGKLYVGYATDIWVRWSGHRYNLNRNNHANPHLQSAVNKYGIDKFLFEILEECEEQYLCSQEHWWCNMLNVHNRKYGYNERPTNPNGSSRASEESKKKMSIVRKAMVTDELRERCRKTMTGRKPTEQQRKLQSERKKKMWENPEIRKRIVTGEHRKRPKQGERIKLLHNKQVIQYTKNGDYVQVWGSINEAAKEVKVHPSTIGQCINPNKINKTAGGYVWKLKE